MAEQLDEDGKASYCVITTRLAILTSPIAMTAFLRELADLSTIVFVGRTGGAEFIGAATLGNMMCNITGFSLAHGLNTALDTFIAQAYGAGLYRETGIHAQRAMLILTVCAIPVALLWSQTSWILENVLNIPHDTAQLAGNRELVLPLLLHLPLLHSRLLPLIPNICHN